MKRVLALTLTLVTVLSLFAACGKQPGPTTGTTGAVVNPTTTVPPTTVPPTTAPSDPWDDYECITIVEAIAICEQTGTTQTSEKYYIRGTVDEIWNETYGNMNITDEAGTLKIYGSYSADGSTRFDAMAQQPAVGDEVLLYGPLVNYKGNTPEMVDAWIIDFRSGEDQPSQPSELPEFGAKLTVAELLALPLQQGEITEGRYLVTATIESITNAEYGAMYITDATGTISVYNSANEDGTVGYKNMSKKPYKGDLVTMSVTVQNYNGTFEIKSGWIISWESAEHSYNEADYTAMTIAQARDAAKGAKVKITGVVAQITYADGFIPSGVIVVDDSNAIYVYDRDLAARVVVGNEITVLASKTYWVLESEAANAEKFGYQGCNQLEDAFLLSNDSGNHEFSKTWIPTTTVKEIMDTPVSADITSTIFKVTALVKKVEGKGFVNYYIDDLDGMTGSYAYTQCSGSDFAWLDEFDGKICTVYLSVLNAKSAASGCVWRFLPIAVSDDGYVATDLDRLSAGMRLYAVPQFLPIYSGDPKMEVLTVVNNDLIGISGMEITYSSSNTDVVWFENEDGKTIFHCGAAGTAEVTIRVSLGLEAATQTITITVEEQQAVEYGTVQDAIDAAIGDIVVIKGIVGPSLVNQDGFYLIDETGIIAVLTDVDTLASLEVGYEIVLEGSRYFKSKSGGNWGNTCVSDAKVLVNNYGNHAYSTESFDGVLTLAEFAALDVNTDYTTYVFTVTATVEVVETAFYTNIKLVDGDISINLYCSSAKQYKWLQEYAGQTITMELAPCNWSSKQVYPACVLAVVLEDGTKIVNTLNFD